MRLKDLRWHILACVILVISYAALAFCFYLPVRAKTIASMELLTIEAVNNDIQLAQEAIESYNKQFQAGNTFDLVTDFDKTSYASKVNNQEFVIAEANLILNDSTNRELYVFYYNAKATSDDAIGGYIPLKDIIDFSIHQIVIFNSTDGIKFNSINDQSVGTMGNLLNDDKFIDNFKTTFDNGYSKVYRISDVEGILAINSFYDFYFGVFISLDSAFFSIEWVIAQAVSFYVIGVLILTAILVIVILGCRKASILLRINKRAVDSNNAIVIRAKKNGDVIFVNRIFKKIVNLKEINNLNEFFEVNTQSPIVNFFAERKLIRCQYMVDGVTKYFQLTPIISLGSYYLIGSEITNEFLRIQALEALNGKNEYTGCNNNFALNTLFPSIISKTETNLAFVEFSIFHYYDIISLFGDDSFHLLLQELLSILRSRFENMDIFQTRDEKFVVLFPNNDLKEVTKSVTETLELLRKPILIKNNNIYVKLKIVICNIEKMNLNDVDLIEIKRRIDLAYTSIVDYYDKDVVVYNEAMEGVISARAQMEEDLKKAIENNEFVQYLQPQVSLSSNKIVGFESLIRWNNPKYIKRSPQGFIELSEQKGYILDISRFIVDNTFSLAKKLEKYNVTISLNLSPIQILQVGFVNDLKAKFDEYELKPGSIALEITETFLMENVSLVNEKLKILKQAGFQIHLDDFCMGYSSMAYLKDLPVDTIKIDYEFTKYVDTNKVNYSIVSCIATLAKELGLDVIVEGVETTAQQAVVKKLGCQIIQGFLISKAVPYDEAVKLLKQYNER